MVPPSPILDSSFHDSTKGAPSFSLRHRLLRALFVLAWLVFARWTPPQFRKWRNFVLFVFGAKIHPTANVYSSARIWYPPNLIMGQYSTIGPGVICYSMDKIILCEYAVVSQRSHLCSGTHDIRTPQFQLIAKPITIGRKAWIASEAFIGPGVEVGEGAVVGARGVVVRDVKPWIVVAGNPARDVGARDLQSD